MYWCFADLAISIVEFPFSYITNNNNSHCPAIEVGDLYIHHHTHHCAYIFGFHCVDLAFYVSENDTFVFLTSVGIEPRLIA